jgi:putative hydrolase of the HAD superfamily
VYVRFGSNVDHPAVLFLPFILFVLSKIIFLKKFKHIFFDLDRTLWDFELNSHTVLNQLIDEHDLEQKCSSPRKVILNRYYEVNDELWNLYRNGKITKEELRSSRFSATMGHFGYENAALGQLLENEYISRSPYQKNLLPYTIETLDYLKQHYALHIITNGFKEVQYIKMENCGIRSYFSEIIISEEVGFNKPDARIFEISLQRTGAKAEESVMIGDDLHVDVIGAGNAGMSAIYFNPGKLKHGETLKNEITELKELLDLL